MNPLMRLFHLKGGAEDGESLTEWAADEITMLRQRLKDCEGAIERREQFIAQANSERDSALDAEVVAWAEVDSLKSEVESLRGRCGELEADANRFKFIARRESHQSMAMVNYEIACISGENPTEDQFREAVDGAMESAHRMSPQGAAPDMGGEK